MNHRFYDNSPYTYKVIGKLCPTIVPYRNYPEPIRYLHFISKDKSNKKALEAKIEYEKTQAAYHQQKGSKQDLTFKQDRYFKELRRDYRYYSSLRTILLYLYNECHIKATRKVDRIRKVLSNPKIIEIAPFLEYWKDFQRYGLDMFNIFSDLLMEIGEELRKQLHIKADNDTYVLRRITERIFSEVEVYLEYILDPPGDLFFIQKYGIEKYNKLAGIRNDYRRLLVSIQRHWLKERRQYLDFYERECNSYDFIKELKNVVIEANRNNRDGFISIDALARKYQMDNWNALNLILEPNGFDPHKPQYCIFSRKKYLMTYSYLISDTKAEELKKCFLSLPKVTNNSNDKLISAKYASSLLKKEGIPENQHPNIISKLGFDIFNVMQDGGLRRYIAGTLNDAVIKEKKAAAGVSSQVRQDREIK